MRNQYVNGSLQSAVVPKIQPLSNTKLLCFFRVLDNLISLLQSNGCAQASYMLHLICNSNGCIYCYIYCFYLVKLLLPNYLINIFSVAIFLVFNFKFSRVVITICIVICFCVVIYSLFLIKIYIYVFSLYRLGVQAHELVLSE